MELIEAMGVLVDALGEQMDKRGMKEDLCLLAVMPGSEVPIDYATCGGMAWVRLVSASPSATFPGAAATPNNCGYLLAYTMEMAVFRASVLPEKVGTEIILPSAEEQFESAELVAGDMKAMHEAMQSVAGMFPDFMVSGYVPQGPEGGAVGGVWSFFMGLD